MTGRGKSSRQRSPDTAALTPLTAAAHLHPQLHSYTAKWTSADLLNCRGRPLQLNTETHSPAQPPPHQRGIFLSDFWIVLLGHKNNVRSRNIIFNYYSNGQRVEGEILY